MESEFTKKFNSESPVFLDDTAEYGVQTKSVPKPAQALDISTKEELIDNIVAAGEAGQIDFSEIQNFTRISQDRNSVYDLIDTMAEDPTIAAALEIYAEDATEPNDKGEIIWAESDDPNIGKYINYLLSVMNVNKNIYSWVYSLVKYGDCYLKMFRQSEFEDDGLFSQKENQEKSKTINEDVVLKAYSDQDPYVHYVEMVPNPAEMFELTRQGKSYAYIKAPVHASLQKKENALNTTFDTFKYQFKLQDVELSSATDYVHAMITDGQNRFPEEVSIYRTDSETTPLTYKVKRGQSILYNSFKIWREMMLLENALLLNRLTKSSLLRVFNIEVGDMPKEQIPIHLQKIKQLIEQKSSINVNNSLQEYTNPGAMENNIYVPVHNQLGSVSTQEIGGNPSSGALDDIDFFKTKLFSSLKIPKQFLGDTKDATGFNGGTSLTIISSRYAKTVKRIQNSICQMVTDIIKLLLLDKGMNNYIGQFHLKMVEPVTQEMKDRQINLSTEVQSIRDINELLSTMQDPVRQLKALKIMLSNVVEDPEIINIIQEQIEDLEQGKQSSQDQDDMSLPSGAGFAGGGALEGDFGGAEDVGGVEDLPDIEDTENENSEGALPSPNQLGDIDFTEMTDTEES